MSKRKIFLSVVTYHVARLGCVRGGAIHSDSTKRHGRAQKARIYYRETRKFCQKLLYCGFKMIILEILCLNIRSVSYRVTHNINQS